MPSVRPSSTSQVMTVSQKIANQSSTMSHVLPIRAASDLAADECQVEHREHGVEPEEADQREHDAALAHCAAGTVAGPEQAVDQPRLTAELGGHPTAGVG